MDVARTRENCDVPSSFCPIFDVPTFLPMTSRAQSRGEIRWNRTDGLILSKPLSRTAPGRPVLENDGDEAIAIELVSWIMLGQTRTDDDPFNRRSRMTTPRGTASDSLTEGIAWSGSSRKCAIVFQRCTFTQRSSSIRDCRHFVLGSII